MKYKSISLLLAALLLTGSVNACAANDAKTPLPTVAATAVQSAIPIEVPETTADNDPAISDTPITTNEIVGTTDQEAPQTTIDAPVTTGELVVTDNQTAPITTSQPPANTTKPAIITQTPAVTTSTVTTKAPAVTTAPQVTAKPVVTTKPAVTTKAPTTTKAPVTTAPPVTEAPHTHSYGAWTLDSDYIHESRTCSGCGVKETQVHYATVGDEQAIADRVIYYINQFRAAEGTVTASKLPRLTLVAEYRSRQLVTNFAHDTDDIREAYTYCKYGEHKVYEETRLDMETLEIIYTGNILDYYSANDTQEAISCSFGYNSSYFTIDTVALRIANSLHESAGHWRYVGASSPYIAVGVTHADSGEWEGKLYNSNWYCCVIVADSNQYE